MTFKWKPLVRHFFMILFSLVMIYPVLWWIGASLKTNGELASPNIFPSVPQWSNFVKGWNSVPGHTFTDFYLNTFALEAAVIAATLVSSTLVAFGFGRLNFPLKNLWFSLFMLTLMMPGQVLIIPQYALFHQLGWVNTYLPFIVPHMLAGRARNSEGAGRIGQTRRLLVVRDLLPDCHAADGSGDRDRHHLLLLVELGRLPWTSVVSQFGRQIYG